MGGWVGGRGGGDMGSGVGRGGGRGGDYFDGAFCCGHIKGLEENGQAGCKERRLANTADQPDVDAPEALEKRGECETGC